MNVAWGVPRNRRRNPMLARVRSLLLLATAGVAVVTTTFLFALGASADGFGATGLTVGLRIVLTMAAVLRRPSGESCLEERHRRQRGQWPRARSGCLVVRCSRHTGRVRGSQRGAGQASVAPGVDDALHRRRRPDPKTVAATPTAAKAHRLKGFENVEVTFDNEGQNASPARQTREGPKVGLGLVRREDEAQHGSAKSDFVS